jgi:hypothetical protein
MSALINLHGLVVFAGVAVVLAVLLLVVGALFPKGGLVRQAFGKHAARAPYYAVALVLFGAAALIFFYS